MEQLVKLFIFYQKVILVMLHNLTFIKLNNVNRIDHPNIHLIVLDKVLVLLD